MRAKRLQIWMVSNTHTEFQMVLFVRDFFLRMKCFMWCPNWIFYVRRRVIKHSAAARTHATRRCIAED